MISCNSAFKSARRLLKIKLRLNMNSPKKTKKNPTVKYQAIQNDTEDTGSLGNVCVLYSLSFEDLAVLGGGGATAKVFFVLPFCFHTWLSETR